MHSRCFGTMQDDQLNLLSLTNSNNSWCLEWLPEMLSCDIITQGKMIGLSVMGKARHGSNPAGLFFNKTKKRKKLPTSLEIKASTAHGVWNRSQVRSKRHGERQREGKEPFLPHMIKLPRCNMSRSCVSARLHIECSDGRRSAVFLYYVVQFRA